MITMGGDDEDHLDGSVLPFMVAHAIPVVGVAVIIGFVMFLGYLINGCCK